MCVYICIQKYIHMHNKFICIRVYICMYKCVHVCIYINIYEYICIYAYIFLFKYICIYVNICTFKYICTYVYICIFKHTHTRIHIIRYYHNILSTADIISYFTKYVDKPCHKPPALPSRFPLALTRALPCSRPRKHLELSQLPFH